MAKGAVLVFGKRILGAEGAAEALRKAQNNKGGGAIQFGPRMTSSIRAKELATAAGQAAPSAPDRVGKAPPPPPAAPQGGMAAGTGGLTAVEPPARSWPEVQKRAAELGIRMAGMKRPALEAAIAAREADLAREAEAAVEAAPAGGYSLDEVIAMLAENPDSWERILDAETKRPEGPRPEVASTILAAMDQFTVPPTEALVNTLTEIAKQEPQKGPVLEAEPEPPAT